MKFIKKHKNKLFILMLTLISALTLFLNVGKTYAYETDEFSYTINENTISTANNATYNSTNKTFTTNTATTNIEMFIDLKETFTANSAYLLLNYKFEWSYDGNNWNIGLDANNYRLRMYNYDGNQISDSRNYQIYYDTRTNANEYTTLVFKFDLLITNKSKAWLRFSDLSSNTYNRLTIYNMDIVTPIEVSLNQYYETYYGQIEENYNNLQELYNELQGEYNDLEEAYEQKEEAYDDLENDYLTLEDEYNDLNQQYNEINNYNQYGDFNNCTLYIENITNGITTNHTLTFNDMITNDIITNSFIYYTKVFQYLNINTDVGFTTVTLQLAKPIPTSNISWIYNDENLSGVTFDLEYVGDDEDWYVSFATDSASPFEINTNFLLTKQLGTNYDISNDSFDQFILTFNYATPNEIWLSNNTNYANSYNRGYNNGYKQGSNSEKEEYEPLIINLRNELQTLNEQITSQRVVINALQEQISSMSSDYNLNNLMWTIASTPFESFKQIWNVNFLGVNITQMVTGLLTAFIVLYIVKKFFL